MGPLYFRTAFPFGYAIFWLGLAGLTLGGAIVAIWSVVHRPRAPLLAAAAAAAAAFAVLVAVVNVRAEESLDWNPRPLTIDSVTGRWLGPDLTLTLRADSTFQCSRLSALQDPCSEAVAGRWHRAGDFILMFLLTRPDSVAAFRLMRHNGVLRLIVEPDDPDMWDGAFRFHHESPSRP